jgi:hypothetical protein
LETTQLLYGLLLTYVLGLIGYWSPETGVRAFVANIADCLPNSIFIIVVIVIVIWRCIICDAKTTTMHTTQRTIEWQPAGYICNIVYGWQSIVQLGYAQHLIDSPRPEELPFRVAGGRDEALLRVCPIRVPSMPTA